MFDISFQYTGPEGTQTDKYLVHHTMTSSCGNEELDAWARDLKLYPWVAVAAPLARSSSDGTFSGRLFSTLILPIPTKQPVHMHGLFAIAPDRARLGFENLAVEWNEFMFEDRISDAWANLLEYRNLLSWQAEGFGLWPRADIAHSDLWTQLDDWVIDQVIANNLKVWNATTGCCVTLEEGFFSESGAQDSKYVTSLAQLQMPIVILEHCLLQNVERCANDYNKRLRLLTPTTVRQFVRNCNDRMMTLPQDASASVLEYCLLDAINRDLKGVSRTVLYNDLGDICLWPTLSGTLAAVLSNRSLFLPRDTTEMQLFSITRPSKTLNVNKLTSTVYDLLQNDISYLGAVMRYRALHDLAEDWPNMYHVAFQQGSTNEFGQRARDRDPLIRSLWMWMSHRLKEEKQKLPSSLGSTWLIPINDSRVRQISPGSNSSLTLIIEKGEQPLADFLLEAASCTSIAAPPLLDTDTMPVDAVKFLRKKSQTSPELRLTCQDSLDKFVDWLAAGQQIVHSASPQQKKLILKHLEKLMRDQTHFSPALASQMRKLPLFSKTMSVAPYK